MPNLKPSTLESARPRGRPRIHPDARARHREEGYVYTRYGPDLKREISEAAEAEGVSFSDLVSTACAAFLEVRKQSGKSIKEIVSLYMRRFFA